MELCAADSLVDSFCDQERSPSKVRAPSWDDAEFAAAQKSLAEAFALAMPFSPVQTDTLRRVDICRKEGHVGGSQEEGSQGQVAADTDLPVFQHDDATSDHGPYVGGSTSSESCSRCEHVVYTRHSVQSPEPQSLMECDGESHSSPGTFSAITHAGVSAQAQSSYSTSKKQSMANPDGSSHEAGCQIPESQGRHENERSASVDETFSKPVFGRSLPAPTDLHIGTRESRDPPQLAHASCGPQSAGSGTAECQSGVGNPTVVDKSPKPVVDSVEKPSSENTDCGPPDLGGSPRPAKGTTDVTQSPVKCALNSESEGLRKTDVPSSSESESESDSTSSSSCGKTSTRNSQCSGDGVSSPNVVSGTAKESIPGVEDIGVEGSASAPCDSENENQTNVVPASRDGTTPQDSTALEHQFVRRRVMTKREFVGSRIAPIQDEVATCNHFDHHDGRDGSVSQIENTAVSERRCDDAGDHEMMNVKRATGTSNVIPTPPHKHAQIKNTAVSEVSCSDDGDCEMNVLRCDGTSTVSPAPTHKEMQVENNGVSEARPDSQQDARRSDVSPESRTADVLKSECVDANVSHTVVFGVSPHKRPTGTSHEPAAEEGTRKDSAGLCDFARGTPRDSNGTSDKDSAHPDGECASYPILQGTERFVGASALLSDPSELMRRKFNISRSRTVPGVVSKRGGGDVPGAADVRVCVEENARDSVASESILIAPESHETCDVSRSTLALGVVSKSGDGPANVPVPMSRSEKVVENVGISSVLGTMPSDESLSESQRSEHVLEVARVATHKQTSPPPKRRWVLADLEQSAESCDPAMDMSCVAESVTQSGHRKEAQDTVPISSDSGSDPESGTRIGDVSLNSAPGPSKKTIPAMATASCAGAIQSASSPNVFPGISTQMMPGRGNIGVEGCASAPCVSGRENQTNVVGAGRDFTKPLNETASGHQCARRRVMMKRPSPMTRAPSVQDESGKVAATVRSKHCDYDDSRQLMKDQRSHTSFTKTENTAEGGCDNDGEREMLKALHCDGISRVPAGPPHKHTQVKHNVGSEPRSEFGAVLQQQGGTRDLHPATGVAGDVSRSECANANIADTGALEPGPSPFKRGTGALHEAAAAAAMIRKSSDCARLCELVKDSSDDSPNGTAEERERAGSLASIASKRERAVAGDSPGKFTVSPGDPSSEWTRGRRLGASGSTVASDVMLKSEGRSRAAAASERGIENVGTSVATESVLSPIPKEESLPESLRCESVPDMALVVPPCPVRGVTQDSKCPALQVKMRAGMRGGTQQRVGTMRELANDRFSHETFNGPYDGLVMVHSMKESDDKRNRKGKLLPEVAGAQRSHTPPRLRTKMQAAAYFLARLKELPGGASMLQSAESATPSPSVSAEDPSAPPVSPAARSNADLVRDVARRAAELLRSRSDGGGSSSSASTPVPRIRSPEIRDGGDKPPDKLQELASPAVAEADAQDSVLARHLVSPSISRRHSDAGVDDNEGPVVVGEARSRRTQGKLARHLDAVSVASGVHRNGMLEGQYGDAGHESVEAKVARNDFWLARTRASRVVATPSLPRNPSVHGSHRSAGRDAALKSERCEKSATRKITRISEDNELDDSNDGHTEVDWDVFTRQIDLTTPTEHHGASQQVSKTFGVGALNSPDVSTACVHPPRSSPLVKRSVRITQKGAGSPYSLSKVRRCVRGDFPPSSAEEQAHRAASAPSRGVLSKEEVQKENRRPVARGKRTLDDDGSVDLEPEVSRKCIRPARARFEVAPRSLEEGSREHVETEVLSGDDFEQVARCSSISTGGSTAMRRG